MNESELKAACIAAGLSVDGGAGLQRWRVLVAQDSKGSNPVYCYQDNPTLPTYVMARLLARAPHPVTFEIVIEPKSYWCTIGDPDGLNWHGGQGPDHATAAIRACMAAREAG